MQQKEISSFTWSNGPPLPVALTAGFVGMDGKTVIYAGGSNFDKPKWEGGNKQFHRDIYVLENPLDNGSTWVKAGELPKRTSDGATLETADGLLCLGGTDGEQVYSDVFLLKWNAKEKKIIIVQGFPPLPHACANPVAERLGNAIYVAGGKTADNKPLDNFWRLDETNREKWENIIPLPSSRFGAILINQNNGEKDCLYLISGKSEKEYLKDAYFWNPEFPDRWNQIAGMPRPAVLAPATALGKTQIVLFSGTDGHDMDKIPHIKSVEDYTFSNEILTYDTLKDIWVLIGLIPIGLVGSRALAIDKKILIVGGEICPSVRTPMMQVADFQN